MTSLQSNVAIIVAAGQSKRMGRGLDKILIPIKGIPLIAYSWYVFDKCDLIDNVVIVIKPETKDAITQLASKFGFKKKYQLVDGGSERQESVWNGLQSIPQSTNIVAIHDAARPCICEELISRLFEAAMRYGAAVAATPVVDTIKEVDENGFIARHLDRSKLWAVQTPQVFKYEVIFKALSEVRKRGLLLSDDTAACEFIDQPVCLIEWEKPNPKVTYPHDILYVEQLLHSDLVKY